MKKTIHAVAGGTAFLAILVFWIATILAEAFGGYQEISLVKNTIVQGLFVLIPSMMIVGASGFSLGKSYQNKLVSAKKKKMPFIALNGLMILVPCALFLQGRADANLFDTTFYIVQMIELVAGATNLALMGMNMRDGLRLSRIPKTI